ncbi:MAG TPA: HEPN domain-containing protein [Nitrospiria bacterium]|jgi:uncharacterized protein (UPF0332 family)
MRPELNELVSKSRESLDAAEVLFQHKFYGFAAARAYYAMFYLSEAALLGKGLTYSKHSAVIGAFGQHFTKTGLVDTKYHRYLKSAYDKRAVGDYAVGVHVSEKAASETIGQAKEFMSVILRYLESQEKPT